MKTIAWPTRRAAMICLAVCVAFSGALAAPSASVVASAAAAAPGSTGAEIEAKRGERQDVQNRIGEIRRQINEGTAENDSLGGERLDIVSLMEAGELEFDELVDLLALYEGMIAETELALAEAERVCDAQRELLKSRVRGMYMDTESSAIETLLSSRDITSFMEKVELFSVISNHDNAVLEDYKAARADVEYKRSLQAAEAERTEGLAAEQRQELDALSMTRGELEEKIRSLQSQIDRLVSQEDELEVQSAKLETEIKELVAKAEAEAAAAAAAKAKAAEEARKKAEAERIQAEKDAQKQAGGGKSSSASGGGSGSGSGSSASSGGMRWPTPGYRVISSGYGNRIHPIKKTKLFHSGIDIAAPSGTSIVAAKAGTVIISRVEGGYGNAVVIDHGGGITTLYGHCSKLLVKSGQKVQAGATIAKVGSTGVSTGPHLHFEVRKNGSPVNPGGYL